MRVSAHLLRSSLLRSSWTVIDQGVVSLGAFLLNIVLARHLPPAEYGAFALVLGTLMLVQLINSSLIFYPMSIRSTVLAEDERQKLIGRSLVLLAGLCLPLMLLVGTGLVLMGRADLLVPLLLYFFVAQVQETLRRGLFAEFRHRDALIGDLIGCLGQVALVLLLLQHGPVDLAEVFYALALASSVALAVNYWQVRADFRDLRRLRATMADFWSLGRWSLANNLTGASRIQLFLWGLAALFGAAATASFQAAHNVINLANPILLGLCNVIPQTAARKFQDGYGTAWLAARPYALAGALPILLCYGVLLVAPELVLHLLYGAGSAYAGLVLPIRILAAGALLGYSADMVCSYMHGVDAARLALLINGLGTFAALSLFLPLATHFGVAGACGAVLASSFVRLIASQWILSRMIADGRQPVV
ncbi:oligosaccharide flippase family protein [Bosea caraganae]|nr:oligosaccharide flippase family protein [Bosea caraganae]